MSQDLIQRIFSIDPEIRYVGILNQQGKHIEGGMRPGITSLNPIEEEDRLFLQLLVARGMSESWSRYFERFRFSIISHDRVKVFQFPFGNNILLVTAEPSISLNVAEKISEISEKETKS